MEAPDIPPIFRELAAEIGHDAAMSIVRVFGGIEMKVPKRNTGGTYYDGIAAVVGKDAANKLVSKYGGNRIKVPRCQRLLTIERWRKIIADFSAGATLNELARKYGLTERGISKALKHAV